MNSSSLIYMIDIDKKYGQLVKSTLSMSNFKNVNLFTDEAECLAKMNQKPKLLITGYHLKDMTGLQFIKKVKEYYPRFYSVLLSDDFHNNMNHVYDERFLQYIDKYIIKGMDDLEELVEAVTSEFS